MYLRELKEASLTDSKVFVVLCQFMTVGEDGSISLEEVTYMDGENCINTTASPLWMQTIDAVPRSTTQREISVPLSDDTESDILGVYTNSPTDDTRDRYIIYSICNPVDTNQCTAPVCRYGDIGIQKLNICQIFLT